MIVAGIETQLAYEPLVETRNRKLLRPNPIAPWELRAREFVSQYSTNASGQASTGLIVCGYQFSDRRPSELAGLFTRAIGELKAASR